MFELFSLYKTYRYCSKYEKYTRNEEHAHLRSTNHLEYETSACSGSNLRKTDGAVEQAEICSDVLA